jgi:hypothetical protein
MDVTAELAGDWAQAEDALDLKRAMRLGMFSDDLEIALAKCLREARRAFGESLLRDVDRTIRLLEQAVVSNHFVTACRSVETAWCLLQDIERYLTALDLESVSQRRSTSAVLH